MTARIKSGPECTARNQPERVSLTGAANEMSHWVAHLAEGLSVLAPPRIPNFGVTYTSRQLHRYEDITEALAYATDHCHPTSLTRWTAVDVQDVAGTIYYRVFRPSDRS